MVLAIALVIVMIVERIPRLQRRRSRWWRPHALTDLELLAVAWIAIGAATSRWVGWASDAIGSAIQLPRWLEVVVALVVLDLGNYVAHWLMHRYEPLWRVHAVHHSSPVLDALATFRAHVLDQLLRRAIAPLGLIALGLSPASVAIASAVLVGWAIVNHANLRGALRFVEPLLITPRLHHLHHVDGAHNLGTVFSIWDRLTGRLARHDVPGDIALGDGGPQGFVALLRAPFR